MAERLEWVCGLCGRVLDRHTVTRNGVVESENWRHQVGDEQRADHEVLPVQVPISQAGLRCDFCHDDVSVFKAHVLHTGDVVLVVPGGGPGGMDESLHMGETWLADELCADLVRIGAWESLYLRGLEGYERRHVQPVGPEARAFMKLIYTNVERLFIRMDPPPPMPQEAP